MQDDKAWERIVDAIDVKFGVSEHGHQTRKIVDAPHLTQNVSFIVFERNGQDFRIERIQGPAIIDKKTIGAKRAGAEVRYQYIYDPEETSIKTVMYRAVGDDWQEIDASALDL